MEDPFPAPVHSLADFPVIAPAAGVTDVYGVFQLFLEGLFGLAAQDDGRPDAFAGIDLSETFARARIRVHGSIYPGGGFVPTPAGYERTRALSERLTTTFSYVPEVLANVARATSVTQAFTETAFYAPSATRWERTTPLVCVFAADAPPRKGIDVALEAFAQLDPAAFHLHVVGPHQHRREELPAEVATFHGWLAPEQLRALHREAHAFVSPVWAEPPGPPGTYQGVTNGFPTQAAADAVSCGCLLVSANPSSDHRVLVPGEHYVDCPSDADRLRATLLELVADLAAARRMAEAGSARLRERMDVRAGIAEKLRLMGFALDGAAREPT